MKLLNSTIVSPNISFSAGYTNGCSVMIVHGKPKVLPENEKPHYHSQDAEYYYILKGNLTVNINGKPVKAKEKMCIVAEPTEIHFIQKISKDVEYIIVRTNILPGEKVVVKK